MRFLYHPDTVLTASDLESLAVSLLHELPLPGVEGASGQRHLCMFTSRCFESAKSESLGFVQSSVTLNRLSIQKLCRPLEPCERLSEELTVSV